MTKLERPTPFDVEQIFDQFVLEIKGELGSNLITNTEKQLNADYVFKNPQVIAELKCLQKNLFSLEDERLKTLVEKWIKQGKYDNVTLANLYISGQLPKEYKLEMILLARKTIDGIINKANKQIKETKRILNMPNAKGLLLLCNDGNYFLKNEHLLSLVCNVMEHKYMESEIDGLVYFTVNQVSRSVEDELDHMLWIPAYRNEGDIVLSDFVNQMGAYFGNEFYTKLTGIPPTNKFITDNIDDGIKRIKSLKYLPKNIAYRKNNISRST